MQRKTGIMRRDVKLTGTDLELKLGQMVELAPADNLPDREGWYFAAPLYLNSWGDASILLDPDDFEVVQ